MRKRLFLLPAFLFVTLSIQSDAILRRTNAAAIPAPADVLGFTPGDDRKLASWAQVVEYFQKLAGSSDRVKFAEIGKSTMGKPFVYATISAPENLAHLEDYKRIQDQLADPRKLSPTNLSLSNTASKISSRSLNNSMQNILSNSPRMNPGSMLKRSNKSPNSFQLPEPG